MTPVKGDKFKHINFYHDSSFFESSVPATDCERRWVSGQELLFDARRVTTIEFSEGRAAKFEQPTTVGGVSR